MPSSLGSQILVRIEYSLDKAASSKVQANKIMGRILECMSRVILVWFVLLLRENYVAAVTDPFVNLWSTSGTLWSMWSSTNPEPSTAYLPDMIRFKENPAGPVFSFHTKFIASIGLGPFTRRQLGYGGSARSIAEGFTFAILPDRNVGGDGGYLGLLNPTSNGDPQSHTFAVEFDFRNSPQFADPEDGFHIGININSMNSTSSVLLEGPRDISRAFWDLQVWIDYDASLQILNVTAADVSLLRCPLSDEERPGPAMVRWSSSNNGSYSTIEVPYNSLSLKVDLSHVLNEMMYVGFTSTGPFPQFETPILYISPWSLRTSNSTSPAAPSASLPCITKAKSSFLLLTSVLLSLTGMATMYGLLYHCYRQRVERRGWRFNIDADDLGEADPHKFTYKELAMATKNFDPKQALGRGGFGSVYKGFLPGNKQYVAVKRVAPESSQGEREFMAEVMTIGKIRHRNLVRLQGWCHERGELLLVYDYMPQGSLDKHLFATAVEDLSNAPGEAHRVGILDAVEEEEGVGFPWERRFKVVVDVATALVYLHTECEERIIHRDVKAANVMLDAKFNARLGDFGLARVSNHSLLTPESTNVAGTFGYFAPELFHTGKQTEQTDVYSFGAFLLEVACGKKPIYHEHKEVKVLVEQVWQLWGNSSILDAADARLAGVYNAHEMTKVLCLGLLCSHPSPVMRPSMRQVLLILNDDLHLPEVPLSKPQFDYNPRSALHDDFSYTSTNPSSMYSIVSATREESR